MSEYTRMANEIAVSLKLSATKGGLDVEEATGTLRFDMDGTHAWSQVIDLNDATDTHVAVPASVAVVGWSYWINLSDETDVEVSTGTGVNFDTHVFAVLYPGEPMLLPLAGGVDYYARSTSEYGTEVAIRVTVVER